MFNLGTDALQRNHRGIEMNVGQNQQEFAAVIAADDVDPAQRFTNPVRNAAKQMVARCSSVSFVGLTKAVDVDQRECRWRAITP